MGGPLSSGRAGDPALVSRRRPGGGPPVLMTPGFIVKHSLRVSPLGKASVYDLPVLGARQASPHTHPVTKHRECCVSAEGSGTAGHSPRGSVRQAAALHLTPIPVPFQVLELQ